METPKTWQGVLLRREYLRGWIDGYNEAIDNPPGIDGPDPYSLAELVELEKLKPCSWCKGAGAIVVSCYIQKCPECGGTGLAPCENS